MQGVVASYCPLSITGGQFSPAFCDDVLASARRLCPHICIRPRRQVMKTMRKNSASSVIPIRLTGLPAALREEGFVPLDYRLLREAAANATIPAHQVNGMWHFLRRDTEEIARALKLTRAARS
jgi:hypothetical protein